MLAKMHNSDNIHVYVHGTGFETKQYRCQGRLLSEGDKIMRMCVIAFPFSTCIYVNQEEDPLSEW